MREQSVGAAAILVVTALSLAFPSTSDAAGTSLTSPSQAKSTSKIANAPASNKPATAVVAARSQGGDRTQVGEARKKASAQASRSAIATPSRPLMSSARADADTARSASANAGKNRSLSPTVLAMRGQSLNYSSPVNQSAYQVAYGRGYGAQYRGQSRQYRFAAYSAGRGAGRGGMSCVPYARSITGMNISGNAWQWWENAAGQYARGQVPEAGSVLAFRSNMRMPMGHVAVISRVESARVVVIDHANWPVGGRRGAVSHGIAVVDVSDRNDWSAVRLALGTGDFGSIYPTHGFIYNRADTGAIRMANRAPAPMLAMNAPPADLRGRFDRRHIHDADRAYDEVAEARDPRPERTVPTAPVRPYMVVIPGGVFNGGN